MEESRELLEEVIANELSLLRNANYDEDKSVAVKNITDLYQLKIEEDRFKADLIEKTKKLELDSYYREEDRKSKVLDRWINVGLTIGTTVGGWVAYSVWQRREQIFELKGTPSNAMFRTLLSNMVPKLKK